MTKIIIELEDGRVMRATLDEKTAPISCENFLKYVDDGFFSGIIFHRVIPGFMIQGGGFEAYGKGLAPKDGKYAPIKANLL